MSAIGLEIGGTWLRGISLTLDGAVGERLREKTPRDPSEAASLLFYFWKRLGASEIVGLAAAPTFDQEGVVVRWPNIPTYVGSHILLPLKDAGVTPFIFDDVSAAAVAEHISATAEETVPSSSVLISLGTGVGAGAVLLNNLWEGATGRAMELGHIPVPMAAGIRCSCGAVGCLQAVASGRYLERRAAEAGIVPEKLSEAAAAGDPYARQLFTGMAESVAQSVRIITQLLDPDRIIFGGGLSEIDYLFSQIAVFAAAHEVTLPLRRGKWGTWAGAVGAAAEALRKSGESLTKLREDSASSMSGGGEDSCPRPGNLSS